jgi:SLT domain-containing protein
MSNRPLEKGIYQLCEQGHGEWVYMRREKKLRTRLFLVRKQPQKRGESRDIVKKRKLT